MKSVLLLGSLFIGSALLAACGGGGGSNPIPTPIQTIKPTAYTAKLIFTGALAGRTVQSDLRQAESVSPMDATATPIPIMVVSPIAADGTIEGSPANAFGGTIQAVVSPQPSATPSATFSNTNPYAALASPAPQPLPTGVIAETTIASNGTQNAQGSGVATANIGAPVDQTPTTNVYAYRAISLECSAPHAGSSAAWKFDGTQFVATTDQTTADVYLTGPACDTPSAESGPTLHIPGGAVTFSTDTPFCNLTASQWSNSTTAIDMHTAGTLNADGSINAVIIGKTADGHIFKMFPNSFGGVNPGDYAGAIEVSGAGVDGF